MNIGDLVKVKKSTTWRNTTLPSTAIIIEVISPKERKGLMSPQSPRYRIHTGELFFARDLEFLES